ncbi:MAG: nucleotidyltransferase family protein [Candidatus Omnitrophica bacterium]|jgi:hypothetical protein|nr:nucleotidyltransferase family protein [Candidatus Omnitrophota bacterium]
MFEPEFKLLLSLSRTAIDQNVVAKILEKYGKALDWDKFVSLSITNGITALTYHALSSLEKNDTIPKEIIDRLQEYYYCGLGRNLKLWKEFSIIHEEFLRNNIQIIPLKGIILGNTLYYNPALRGIMADIDFLIQEQNINSACLIMEQLGYIRDPYQPGHIYTFRKTGLMIEMHWNFLPPNLSTIDMEIIWKNSKEAVIDNRKVTILSWEDTLLTLPLQVRFDWPQVKLFRFCDINEIILQHGDRLNWKYIARQARKWQILGPLVFSLYCCETLFNTKLTKQLKQELPLSRLNKILFYLFKNGINKTAPFNSWAKWLILIHPKDYFRILLKSYKN